MAEIGAAFATLWAPLATLLAAFILIDQAYIRIRDKIRPATSLPARIKKVEEKLAASEQEREKIAKVLEDYEHINKLQCQAMLDIMRHMRDGNHVENMNKTIKEIEHILVEI